MQSATLGFRGAKYQWRCSDDGLICDNDVSEAKDDKTVVILMALVGAFDGVSDGGDVK